METHSYRLTEQEHATVLAALRYYQLQGLADDPQLRPDAIHDIATGGDAGFIASLDGHGLDKLCERLNTEGDAQPVKPDKRIAAALRLATARAERELAGWPERAVDNPEHRALRAALDEYQHAFDLATGGAS